MSVDASLSSFRLSPVVGGTDPADDPDLAVVARLVWCAAWRATAPVAVRRAVAGGVLRDLLRRPDAARALVRGLHDDELAGLLRTAPFVLATRFAAACTDGRRYPLATSADVLARVARALPAPD